MFATRDSTVTLQAEDSAIFTDFNDAVCEASVPLFPELLLRHSDLAALGQNAAPVLHSRVVGNTQFERIKLGITTKTQFRHYYIISLHEYC